MSVEIKKDGKAVIKSEMIDSAENYVARMNALISVVQLQDEPGEEQWHLLEIIREMLPTHEQAKKMFNTPH